MLAFLERCFSMPVLPATVLLLLVCVYWLFVVLGALDLDLLDVDLEADLDTDPHSLLSAGLAPLRFLNIGEVPLMLWVGLFALSWWSASMVITGNAATDALAGWQALTLAVGVSLIATKAVTQPMRGWFRHVDPHTPEELIGRRCLIESAEATETYGFARFETGAAPLLLTVRCAEGDLAKGDVAEIIDYDADRRVYHVRKAASDHFL